jgi:hypothetical protein
VRKFRSQTQKRWKLPTFYSVLEQTRIEVIHRAVGVIIIISVARRREILKRSGARKTFRMFKIENNKKIELSRKKKKNKTKKQNSQIIKFIKYIH